MGELQVFMGGLCAFREAHSSLVGNAGSDLVTNSSTVALESQGMLLRKEVPRPSLNGIKY